MSAFPDEPSDEEPGAAPPQTPVGAPGAGDVAEDEQGVAEGEPAPLDPDDTEH